MPKVHMQSKFGDKTYDSLEAYEKDQGKGWVSVEKRKVPTMKELEDAGAEGVQMMNPDIDEGHVLHFVKDGGRRRGKKTRKLRRKTRKTRKSFHL